MANSKTFPKPGAYLLGEAGLVRPDGRPAERVAGKDRVLVSRSMARYQFVQRPKGLSGAQADRSVRLIAEAHAPFPDSDFLIQRNVLGYGIWWWDAARIRELMATRGGYDPLRIAPETLLTNVGGGWRQVETHDGFEAQYWRDLTLIASTWRRRAFAPDQWSAFVDSVGDVGEEAPLTPPLPTRPPASIRNLQKVAVVVEARVWDKIEQGALFAAVASAAIALFFLAQGARFEILLRNETAQRDLLKGAAGVARTNVMDTERGALQAMASDFRRPNPLLVSASAIGALKSFGQTPLRWAVEEDKLRLEAKLPATIAIEEVAGLLERNDFISNVRPQVDPANGNAVFVADICPVMGEGGCGEIIAGGGVVRRNVTPTVPATPPEAMPSGARAEGPPR